MRRLLDFLTHATLTASLAIMAIGFLVGATEAAAIDFCLSSCGDPIGPPNAPPNRYDGACSLPFCKCVLLMENSVDDNGVVSITYHCECDPKGVK